MAEATNPLAALVKPVIDRASKDLNESVMACRLGREGPTCMAVAISTQPITVNIQVGTVLPLHATAQGKLWLAEVSAEERQARLKNYAMVAISDNTIADKIQMEQEFERIRKQGFALNRGENEPDIAAAAVPVRSEDGEIFLSLSAFGMLSRFSEALIRRAIDRLKSAAGEIRSARHEVA
ncbi:MAG: IclR family transcriptional regulator C-terminal domain-containing protein [Pseudomonadota bacterium]